MTTSAATTRPGAAADTLTGFVRRLIEHAGALEPHESSARGGSDFRSRLDVLGFADAALRLALAPRDPSRTPLQIAVIGPTQSGKSTSVNLLLGNTLAGVSPMAGFTIHPQGFRGGATTDDGAWQARFLPGWDRVTPDQLDREHLHCFTLVDVGESPPEPLPGAIYWDTPDFDSLAAPAYRHAVYELIALADVVLLVVSDQKYNDLSVHQLLAQIAPLTPQLVACLNKASDESREVIAPLLHSHLAQASNEWASSPVVVLPYDARNVGRLEAFAPAALRSLRAAIAQAAQRARPDQARSQRVAALLRANWPRWTAPIRAEQAALAQWTITVDAALDQVVSQYQHEYLDNSHRYDSFRRATVELLHLLELPGFAGTVGQLRRLITWPARQLWQTVASRRGDTLASEERVLLDAVDRLLTALEGQAARNAEADGAAGAVWRALMVRLQQSRSRLSEEFAVALQEHRATFKKEIDAAANELFERLQQRPALLATLRGARATADLASIAIALKTGGVNLNDLLYAPAMFGVSSLLAEGTVGGWAETVKAQLKHKQLTQLRDSLVGRIYREALLRVAAELDDPALIGIDVEQLAAAEAALKSLERGDVA